jgi:transketolase
VKAVNPQYERLGELSVKLDDIKRFRQLDSKCAGHPEYRWTSGIETTTGPLGAGVATSVGMAIAGRWQATHFNRPGFEMFDYDVYALAGDGCMMEGISGEAASLAGHLKLSNLCWIYDNNKITIEGHTEWAFSEDVATRFIAYGWNVTRVGDANDLEMLERAFKTFKNEKERPTLIIVDSHIAWGSPNKQDTHAAHGEPLGEDEIKLTKRNYGWPEDAKFLVPTACASTSRVAWARGVRICGRRGWRCTTSTAASTATSPISSSRCSGASCRPAGTRTSRRTRPTPRARPAATCPARSSTRSPRTCRGCSAAPPTWRRRPRPA